ncbi:MAG: hypothetical protein CSA36_06285 [Draconibacterium sp.]|nr:MAG: hypothetical protein CSA36_06285 [Draconibacterium sp.]
MKNIKNPLIFLIEDSVVYKDLIEGHLHAKNYLNTKTYKHADECLKDLSLKPDLIILDYSIDGMSGLELMRKVRKTDPKIEFIFLSGQNNVEVAVKIMKLGAADYVVKNDKAPERLVKAIAQTMAISKSRRLRKGFTIGVFGFFILLLVVIGIVILVTMVFGL